ncbi:hypothetical protein D9M71_768280 [compost metagenome]
MSRSCWVIWVMLPNGMIWVATAWAWIRGAICLICCGVSNITPAGAALNNGLVGLAEWHTAQRSWMTLWILSKPASSRVATGACSATGAAAGAAAAGACSAARSLAFLPPWAVSGSGWYSIFAAACSGAVGIGAGPVT